MPRTYDIPFENVLVSAAQDLVAVKGSSGKQLLLRAAWVYAVDTSLVTAQGFRTNVKFTTATITLGSGGSAATPTRHDNGDAAASFTAHVNDTTPSTTSGAFTNRKPGGGHLYAGWDYTWPKDDPIIAGLNEGIVFELLSTLSGTVHLSGGITVTEIG